MSVEIDLGAAEQDQEFSGFETEGSNADARVDRLAELLAWDEVHKKDPRSKELAALKKDLIATAHKDDPEGEVTIYGDSNMITVSKPSIKRTVKPDGGAEAIHKIMGNEAFYKIISVSLGKIDDYLTPEQREKVLEVDEFGGSRSVSVSALPKG